MDDLRHKEGQIKRSILVVEDDNFIANCYRRKLQITGYDVTIAQDGLEAMEVLKNRTPDLMILDLVMPKMDGFSVLEKIQQNPQQKSIPILVSSNLVQSEDIERAKKLGATEFIDKSDTTMDNLIKMIDRILSGNKPTIS